MILWGVIGAVVGTVLGLTGAGGAVVAVPLFMYLLGISIHDATLYSLMAVLISATLGWVVQRKSGDNMLAFVISVFSFLGSSLAVGMKQLAPAWIIQNLFIALCLASLVELWRKQAKQTLNVPQQYSQAKPPKNKILIASLSGVVLGGLTTMTGLGGGVILVPWLSGPMGLPLPRAVATSLLTIVFASFGSLIAQRESLVGKIDYISIGALIAGSIVAARLTKFLVGTLNPEKMNRIRVWTLTFVITLSIAGLIWK